MRMSGLYPKRGLHHSQHFQFRLKFSPLKASELMEREIRPPPFSKINEEGVGSGAP
jgi:hypothetical protein